MSKVELKLDLAAFGRVVRERAEHLAETAAEIVREEIVQGMEAAPPRTGREYRVPGVKTIYTASAPGEPPGLREGAYAKSWKVAPAIEVEGKVVARAYSDHPQDEASLIGEMLEFGTSTMAPRPHIRPAFENAIPKIRELVRKENES